MLGGGDLVGAFSNDDDTKKALEFITSPTFKFSNPEDYPYISPHKGFDTNQYADEITKEIAKLFYGASAFRFDGSDLMPGSVGAGTFWKGMTAWISGQKDLDEALKEIDESWPN
jgi:alpha-glucoside transport system substrate-binding protein